jgi:hypothetical protein
MPRAGPGIFAFKNPSQGRKGASRTFIVLKKFPHIAVSKT